MKPIFSTFFSYVLIAIIVFFSLSDKTFAQSKSSDEDTKVLVLLSYHQTHSWTADILDGVKTAFAKADMEIEFHVEFMDSKRNHHQILFPQLEQLYQTKYSDTHFDLILLADNNALNFLLPRRTQLFPDVPIVFCGINNFTPKLIEGISQITGVAEASDFSRTIDLALALQPQTQYVAIVCDHTPTGLAHINDIQKIYPQFTGRLKFIELFNQTEEELKASLQNLPEHSVVFLLSLYHDRAEKHFTIPEQVQLLSENVTVPIYTAWDISLGYGVIGGVMTDGYSQGKNAAEIAVRILRGESATEIPVLDRSPNIPMLDYKVMKHFGFSQEMLPVETTFTNKPVTFYTDHYRVIWLTLCLFLFLLLLISYLLINIRQRKGAEQRLNEQSENLKDIVKERTAELSASNTNLSLEVEIRNKALEQEKNLTHIIDKSLNEICIFDANSYKFLFVNGEARKNLGYSQAEFLEMTPLDIKPQIDRQEFDSLVAPLKNGQKEKVVFDTIHKRKDGSTYPIEVHVKKTDYHARPVLVALIVDITERKKAESLLRVERDKLQNIFGAMVDGIYISDEHYNLSYVNPVLTKHFGEYKGKKCYEYFHTATEPCTWCKNSDVLAGKTVRWEWTSARNGKTYDLIDTPIKNADNTISKLEIFRDITEQKKMEEQLLVNEKLATIAGLAAGVAHEINTPLSAILQAHQLVEMGLSPNNPVSNAKAAECNVDLVAVQKYFEANELDYFMTGIRDSASNAGKIIKSLLEFSRPHEGTFTTINLLEIMNNSLLLSQADYEMKKSYNITNVRFVEEYDSNSPPITCVPSEIEQVLLNLIKNSAQAMASADMDSPPCITLRTSTTADKVLIEIEDNGPGISEDIKMNIFDPFFTTKEIGEGTGLGLSMSHAIIVDKHKGAIRVESVPGQGAKFIIELPL